MSFLFLPSLGLKTSVRQGGGKHYPSKCWTVIREESCQEESQRTYPGVAGQAQIPQDNRVPLPTGNMTLRLPHTRFGISLSLLPTHRHRVHQAQPLPHPRVGSTSKCRQGAIATTHDAVRTSEWPLLLHLPALTRGSGTAKAPTVASHPHPQDPGHKALPVPPHAWEQGQ